jgi:hypothetical protein|tara:strand:+ start:243 stop:686 length:444 start_codon:yes stop_codon:yes gene_type:complete
MNLKEIQAMWKSDCQIDDIELDASSLEVPKLHAKYAELLQDKKLEVIRFERKMKELDKDKWLWYGGKMTRDQIEDHNWDYDPFGGLTVLKSDYHKFTGADKDIQDLNDKLQYLRVSVEALTDIVSQITWRHQTIKNIIEWRKFMAGS